MVDVNKPIPIDQAYRLRQLVSEHEPVEIPARPPTHVIAIASGKGGVGKTMASVNLSIALAARGQRVILFDMDMGLANADIILGVEAVATWSDVLHGQRSFDEVIVQAPGQIAFVPGASGIASLANLSEFERHKLAGAMQQAESCYDIAVLDCGAGISRNVIGFGTSADTVLVVCTPEPTAMTDAYAMIKAFAVERSEGMWERCATVGVLVNVAETRREARETYERLAGVAARFLHMPVSDYGYILRDDHVAAAVRQRCPVILRYPRCSASLCMMATAARLEREFIGVARNQAGGGLFARVMNLFT